MFWSRPSKEIGKLSNWADFMKEEVRLGKVRFESHLGTVTKVITS